MLEIKHRGNTTSFESLNDLKDSLKNHRDEHLTLLYKAKSGIVRCMFITIDDSGLAFESYGENNPVDFESIKKDLS